MIEKSTKNINITIIILGFTTISTQIILLREFLSVFGGNELIIGVILANWMLLTGLGSFIGRYSYKIKSKLRLIAILFIVLSVLPPVSDILLHKLRIIFIPSGSITGIIQIFIISLALLLPFCIISGYAFTLFCEMLTENTGKNQTGMVYSYESAGSVAGGLAVSLVLVFFFSNINILFIISIIAIITALNILLSEKNIIKWIMIIAAIPAVIYISGKKTEIILKSYIFKDHVLSVIDTPYGNLVVTKTGNQVNFFENGSLLFSTGNLTECEESVHYALVQHPNPKRVLLISGGIKGLVPEILKYKPDRIDYVEINPYLIKLGMQYVPDFQNSRLNLIIKDARFFIKRTKEKYDAVIIDLPSPCTASLNRYYTLEFFRELFQKLNTGAVVSLSLASTSDYVSSDSGRLSSVIYRTLSSVFRNVIIIPGGKNYFLASNTNLDHNIGSMIDKRGIENVYVNQYYINDIRLKERSDFILSRLFANNDVNSDFHPVSYFQQIKIWLNQFSVKYLIPALIFFALLVALFFFIHPVNLGILTVGFAASTFEFVLIIAFQIIYGYVYAAVGIIISLFMLGLASGSYFFVRRKDNSYRTLYNIQLVVLFFSIFLALIMAMLSSISEHLVLICSAFAILSFFSGFITGSAFSTASSVRELTVTRIASGLYSVDLLGSAFGVLLVSAFLFPLYGIVNVCILAGFLNILSGLIVFIKGKNILSL
jgi:spermidine synthase